MRILMLLSIIFIALYSCNSSKPTMKAEEASNAVSDTLRIANDELEYELIIIEPGFNSWLVTQFPMDYYSQSTLENRNTFYVAEYNRRVLNPGQHNAELYPMQINYEPRIDYGMEVNYLLYNYFVFFEKTYNQKLR